MKFCIFRFDFGLFSRILMQNFCINVSCFRKGETFSLNIDCLFNPLGGYRNAKVVMFTDGCGIMVKRIHHLDVEKAGSRGESVEDTGICGRCRRV